MTADRIKEIQDETAFPDSVSVCQALMKVWNECEQERMYSEEEAGELVYNIMGEYAKRENIFFKGDLINNLFEQFKKK